MVSVWEQNEIVVAFVVVVIIIIFVVVKFVKLCHLAPFSNRASLKMGPCQKLPFNCN